MDRAHNEFRSRRRWLKALGAGLATTCLPTPMPMVWAADAPRALEKGRMIVVFLRGAMDGLFAFAPVDDPQLAALRPNLSRRVVAEGLRLAGTGFAAHPGMKEVAALFHARQLAFCPTAGTTDSSRSHFQAQDLFELGNGSIRGGSGFMARLADALSAGARAVPALSGRGYAGGDVAPISFTREVPVAFQGAEVPPQIAPLSGSGLKMPEGRVLDAIRRAHAGRKSGDAIEQAVATQSEIDSAMDKEGAARGATPAAGFVGVAGHLGRILRANRRLGLAYIDLGGFDTHIAEEQVLTRLLEAVSGGLVALSDALGPDEWARTRVAFMTEFGRTVRENGTQGTDHGHGSLFLLAGGNLAANGAGGRMIGSFSGLSSAALNEDRDLPVLADWRDLLSSVAAASFGLPERTLDQVFPGRPGRKIAV